MLKFLMHAQVRKFEREFGYDAGYMHELVDLDPMAFWKFSRVAYAGEHRGGLPAEAVYAAKLAATMHEDCGPCAQLVIDFALKAGVAPGALAALAAGDLAAAPPDAALAFRFARAVLTRGADLDEATAAIERRFGRRGPALLGMALTIARIFPVLKRAMGHAHACTRLDVAGRIVTPAAA
jgi:hypothetical protein